MDYCFTDAEGARWCVIGPAFAGYVDIESDDGRLSVRGIEQLRRHRQLAKEEA